MGGMFAYCGSLSTLDLGEKFNTSSVTYMYEMFLGCSSLTALDLGSAFSVRYDAANKMFGDCTKLSEIRLSSALYSGIMSAMYLRNDYGWYIGEEKVSGNG